MLNVQGRILGSVILIAAAMGFGVGCGGVVEEPQEPQQIQELATQEAAATEEPRKIEDLIAALDEQTSILYVQESSQDAALTQLKAQRIDTTHYQASNPLTGEAITFTLKPYPLTKWPGLFKICSNGQWVFAWMPCPTLVFQNSNLQVWVNSACSLHVQSPGWGICTNTSSGGSYNYQYMDGWKCGVGVGICVNWRAVRTIRYDYSVAACNSSFIQNVTPYSNYYCR